MHASNSSGKDSRRQFTCEACLRHRLLWVSGSRAAERREEAWRLLQIGLVPYVVTVRLELPRLRHKWRRRWSSWQTKRPSRSLGEVNEVDARRREHSVAQRAAVEGGGGD
jgi:hypothetical protein